MADRENLGAPSGEGPRLVLLSQRLGAVTDAERRIDSAGATVRSVPLWNLADVREHAAHAAVIILGAVEPFDAAILEELPACVAIVRRGVGFDNVDTEAATRLGIVVANVPDASVDEVAEHALALLLAVERGVVSLDRVVQSGAWRHDPAVIGAARGRIRRIADLTLGIVGFGRIGRALAGKAAGLYREVIASDPYADAAAAERLGTRLVSMDDLLAQSDHVSLHLPRTEGTGPLVDAAAIGRMRPSAVLVNTARGGLVDEVALREAVNARHLRGAGIDVTAREPLPLDDGLLGVDGIILTGHSAMASLTAQEELSRRSVEAVLDLLDGRRPQSIVNEAVLSVPALRLASLAEAPHRG